MALPLRIAGALSIFSGVKGKNFNVMDNRSEHIYGNLKVVQNNNYQWGVEDLDGNNIVSYGKYAWIDGYDYISNLIAKRSQIRNNILSVAY